jgi:hydroxyethylthiazole kinase-like uncharacterized protein yjeF
MMQKLELSQFADYLTPRPLESHKGDFGHVLVIGGEWGYVGASQLAAEAALRVGAGRVSVASRLSFNPNHPEIMCHAVNAVAELNILCDTADVLIIGPGLGQTAWSKMLWDIAIQTEKPVVLDADGLNLLAEQSHLKAQSNWILTPHLGEASRLLKQSISAIKHDRLAAVAELQARWGGTIVLKGANSIVQAVTESPVLCPAGNPGMATAGMGDVLSGVLGGLLAQGFAVGVAAKLGVLIHAMAGDLAAKTGERGMIASDLMPYLRQLVN